MRFSSLVLGVALLCVVAHMVTASEADIPRLLSAATYSNFFNRFVKMFRKSYTAQTFAKKRQIFEKNVDHIEQHNRLGNSTFKEKITRFADLDPSEFRSKFLTGKNDGGSAASFVETYTEAELATLAASLPASYDLRQVTEYDAIGPAKQQGDCGSCWVFGAMGAVESAFAKALKSSAPVLAEQALMDCSSLPSWGCRGGLLGSALMHLRREGLYLDRDYPYVAEKNSCQYNNLKRRKVPQVGTITNIVSVGGSDTEIMAAVMKYGAVSVGINADNLNLYDAGIVGVEMCPSNSNNHIVTIVGWGTANTNARPSGKIDYFIVRNSWGDDWGEPSSSVFYPGKLGYYRVERNGKGVCGIYKKAYAVVVSPIAGADLGARATRGGGSTSTGGNSAPVPGGTTPSTGGNRAPAPPAPPILGNRRK